MLQIIAILKNINIRKSFNYLKLRIGYIFFIHTRKHIIKANPSSVSIEPTTTCNLQCLECPSGQKRFSRPEGNISMDLFKNILNQIYKDLIYLTLYFQGEPYLHKNFFDFVEYAKQKNIYVSTSTNGHFFTPENIQKTIDCRLDRLIISLDGTTPEIYTSYRKNGNFEKVVNGIRDLSKAKMEQKKQFPHIILQFIVFSSNEHQIEDIKKLAKDLGVDELQLKSAQIYDYENKPDLIPINKKYARYIKTKTGNYILKNKLKNRCFRMWSSCVFCWDGRVVPCCFDKDAEFQMGDLKSQSFKEIWTSTAYKNFRKQIISHRENIHICNNCSE